MPFPIWNCLNCCRPKKESWDDVIIEGGGDVPSPGSCLGKFLNNPITAAAGGVVAGAGGTYFGVGVAAKMVSDPASIIAAMSLGTTPWIIMTTIGGVGVVVVVGSLIAYGCASPEPPSKMNRYTPTGTSTYELLSEKGS